jgi:hypothetical protein
MTLQTTVNAYMSAGVVGELFKGSDWRCQPGIIDSDPSGGNLNLVGAAYTQVVGSDGHVKLGGSPAEGGLFAGILCNPKEYALLGTAAGGTLAPTLALPRYTTGSFCRNTTGLFVPFEQAGNVDDYVDYDTSTGKLYPRASYGTTGVGTVASTSNVITVASLPGGSPAIGVGTVFQTPKGPATVISLGTGTGGNGTYNVTAVTDFTATAGVLYNSPVPAGRVQIPGCRVAFYNIPAAGLGVIAMNNP